MSVVTEAPEAPDTRVMRFIGRERDFWRLTLRGALLLMVTLGIYRFWLATDIRRFMWGNTAIEGEYLEYAGTSIELLRGFLVAVALLLPVYTVSLITAVDLGAVGTWLGVAAFVLLAFLSQCGIYLARRYRLTRTVFRGLRFHLSGSAIRYSFCAVWWWSLTAFTLGLAYPFARASLERFKMRNTYYGDLQGRFEAAGWRLFLRGFLMWLAVITPLLVAFAALLSVNWPAALEAMRGGGDLVQKIEAASSGFVAAIGTALLMILTTLALIVLLLPAFHAATLRWWISGLRFGEIVAKSHLRMRDVYKAYLRFAAYLLGFLCLIVIGIFLGLLFIGLVFGGGQSKASEIVVVLMIIGLYVISALGISTIYQAVVSLSIWRLAAESVELTNTGVIAATRAAGGPGSSLGEGIADVLNIGGI